MTQLADRIAGHISALTENGPRHPENPAAVSAAQDYITSTLAGFGYDVARQQYGTEPHQVNYTVRVGSTDQPVLDIGAHWDTVPGSPGADDNASGAAGLLEIARELAAAEPAQPVRLCFFAEEEAGGLPGSTAHVTTTLERGEAIAAGISLEMIAYTGEDQQLPPQAGPALAAAGVQVPEAGDFIAVVGDDTAADWVAALLGAAAGESLPALPLVAPAGAIGDAGRSDHAAYWQQGLPGIMITDTANFRNPHYHQPSDTLETLDLEFAAQVVQTIMAAVRGGSASSADQADQNP
ncbi:M20/M25/M40 family metallo-hydrolase [Nesterenkonia ebinurensis]|uniref:M20/M25/M40 family metallo-hydrolase n=1 Tax=Nesterenkonia ebinurensis TaxID=2608252 RepID=UPI00123E03EF|nr:M20/M25/M40 family metallo-hydrolase [Nesterenkonia ebinurensis]